MKIKIISFLTITIFLVMISSGCLSSENTDIDPDSIEITDFQWGEYKGYTGIFFEATINFKNEENYQAQMYIDKPSETSRKNRHKDTFILKSGDNLVTGIYHDFYEDFNPTEKGKLQLYINSPTGKLITSKIIEKPYFDATISSDNKVIYRSDYFYNYDLDRLAGKKYLTIQNTGNLDADFIVGQRGQILEDIHLCGVVPVGRRHFNLEPGETQKVELGVPDYGYDGDCVLLKQGETEIFVDIIHNNNPYELDSIKFKWIYDK